MKLMLTAFLFFSSLLVAETRLAILGSGTPNPDPERMGSAYAVIVKNNAYLVDFGPGVIRRASELSSNWGGDIDALIPANLKYAFLTHFHSDHTMGLSDFLLTPWIMGRDEKVELYGPKELKNMAENILEAYKSDIDYRINGTQPANKFGYKFNFHRLKNGVIFENEDLKVESFRVDHGGLEESYGFRFTSSDKVIVFSGDTGPSKVLESYAKDADILVHEVYSYAGFLNKTPDWQKYHKGHHTSTLELGEIAKRVRPKKLVLSHILFWGSTPDEIYEEISSVYDGEVIVAKDLMVIN